jgi:hypothetical protein
MAIALTTRIATLQTEVRQQRDLIQQQRELLDNQQAILEVQFKRIADIQAELDLVKATVRLAAPEHAARYFGPQPRIATPASPSAA